ncbi:Guanylate cyclase soluble subunit alpha-3 [Tupaia chinensis]|uniref:Guanylate cyclase soluble subunit alpha-3 n=1 Tax=Tupaia chinensis TaxID=246437 RepID=L8YCN5_TUPCH|nr:Guanylate cyclase soluble subunit alpha-3 [Tupaia chinensis]
MFCTKLKDLRVTGECPFSLLGPGQATKEPTEQASGNAESQDASLPMCQGVPEKHLPQRKASRGRVYLHTLAGSIRRLLFPEDPLAQMRRWLGYRVVSVKPWSHGPSPCVDHPGLDCLTPTLAAPPLGPAQRTGPRLRVTPAAVQQEHWQSMTYKKAGECRLFLCEARRPPVLWSELPPRQQLVTRCGLVETGPRAQLLRMWK